MRISCIAYYVPYMVFNFGLLHWGAHCFFLIAVCCDAIKDHELLQAHNSYQNLLQLTLIQPSLSARWFGHGIIAMVLPRRLPGFAVFIRKPIQKRCVRRPPHSGIETESTSTVPEEEPATTVMRHRFQRVRTPAEKSELSVFAPISPRHVMRISSHGVAPPAAFLPPSSSSGEGSSCRCRLTLYAKHPLTAIPETMSANVRSVFFRPRPTVPSQLEDGPI